MDGATRFCGILKSGSSYTRASSNYLNLGLPLFLVVYILSCNILFGIAVSFILSTCPNHCSLWALMNLWLLLL
jgi:hypothetical protein